MRLLSPVEQAYLDGTREFTKTQQRYIRCRLRKKLRLVNEQSCNAAARLQHLDAASSLMVAQPGRALATTHDEIDIEKRSLGRDSSPGPLPYQGNALPG